MAAARAKHGTTAARRLDRVWTPPDFVLPTPLQEHKEPVAKPCPDCGAEGIHNMGHRWVPRCDECANKRELQANARREEERLAELEAAFCQSGVPEKFLAAKLTDAERTNTKALDGHSILLCGNAGVGKTHLAAAFFREMINRRKLTKGRQSFESLKGMILEIQSSYNKNAEMTTKEIVDHYCDISLLTIDDLGIERTTSDSLQWIEFIINERWANEKFTIYTTNLSLGKIAEVYGDRVASRLSDSVILKLEGTDRRGNLATQRFDEKELA